jgi:hypothetical protein
VVEDENTVRVKVGGLAKAEPWYPPANLPLPALLDKEL